MEEMNWSNWQPTVRATLLFIVDEDRGEVLLIRKKRGLGAGKINGPGGKIDPGETSLECAVRETREELGVTALDPVKRGELWFEFTDGLRMLVDVFQSRRHQGVAQETDEAVPLWTPLDRLPLEEMWADDSLWLSPMLHQGALFTGRFLFEGDVMLSSTIEWSGADWSEV